MRLLQDRGSRSDELGLGVVDQHEGHAVGGVVALEVSFPEGRKQRQRLFDRRDARAEARELLAADELRGRGQVLRIDAQLLDQLLVQRGEEGGDGGGVEVPLSVGSKELWPHAREAGST